MDFLLEHLHPKLAHFPIGLFIGALIFETISRLLKKDVFHQTARHMYILAVCLTPLVVKAGLWEEEKIKMHHPVFERHELFALITMWGSLVSLPILWFIQKKWERYFRLAFAGCLILMVGFVSTAAHYGGRLVYEYAIGVEE